MTTNSEGFKIPDGYTTCVLLVSFDSETKEFILVMNNINIGDDNNLKMTIPEDYVHYGEMANQRAIKIVENTIGLSSSSMFIRHVGIFDDPNRDSRGWFITNVFYAVVEYSQFLKLTTNQQLCVISESELQTKQNIVAWDHNLIVNKIMANIKNDVYTQIFNKTLFESDIISELFGKEFSAGDLQALGNSVGLTYDRTTYYRNINKYYKKSRSVRVDGIKKPITFYKKGR